MASAPRDDNRVPSLIAVSDVDSSTPVILEADPTNKALKVEVAAGGLGLVQYTEGDTDTTFTGNLMLAEGPSNTATPLLVDAAGHLQVDVAAIAGSVDVNLQDGAGTDITSTLVGADQSLDVNLTQSVSLTVTATDLDIRDLTSASDSIAAVQSGTWNITNVSGTVSLPTGAATAAKQLADGHNVTVDNATIAVTQSGQWDITDISGTVSLPTGAATAAKQLADAHNVTVPEATGINGGPVTVGTAQVEMTFTGTTKSLSIQSDPDNTGIVWVGLTGVTNTGGNAFAQLEPGASFEADLNDASAAIYAISDTASQNVLKSALT